jgi:hypothetical protein
MQEETMWKKTKNGMRTRDVTFQVVENPNGQIQMWPKGGEARNVFGGPVNVSRVSGRSGDRLWQSLNAVLDL